EQENITREQITKEDLDYNISEPQNICDLAHHKLQIIILPREQELIAASRYLSLVQPIYLLSFIFYSTKARVF
ncbi:hypothetical protein ACJX0J_033550, partial [Zea mays]